MNNELLSTVNYMERERGLNRELIIRAIESAIETVTSRYLGCALEDIRVQVDRKKLNVKAYRKFVVSDDDTGPTIISLEKARKVSPTAVLGDEVEVEIPPNIIGRIGIQNARQQIIQKLRQVERDNVVQNFRDRRGEIVTGVVRQITRHNDVIVEIEGSEAILPARECIAGESFEVGDNVRALIHRVQNSQTQNAPAITLSRTCNDFLKALFVFEASEIGDGTVEIMGVARDPGLRAKIAVRSHDEKVDPVGSCVGIKGVRVRNIVSELNGEKVDIVRWNADICHYVAQALSPAKLASVELVSDKPLSVQVRVDPDQLSLAIGRKGQNVRLATALTGCRIEIIRSDSTGESFESQLDKKATGLVELLSDITKEEADKLVANGFLTPEGIIEACDKGYLGEETEFSDETVQRIWNAAAAVISGTMPDNN